MRLDVALVSRGLAPTRAKAQAMIMAGLVSVGGERCDKAGTRVAQQASIAVKPSGDTYASRGGLKLEAALEAFGISPQGRVCLDAGASTGGFTDVLLRRGAELVHAVDVGRGQLAQVLRDDPRVRLWERTNLRYLTAADVEPRPSLVTLDLSFISLTKVWPAVSSVLLPDGQAVALIKPQFEVGRKWVGKGGVVRDAAPVIEAIRGVFEAAGSLGLHPQALVPSPLRGPAGNIEFLSWYAPVPARAPLEVAPVVKEAWAAPSG